MTPRTRRNRRNNGGPDDDATQWLDMLTTGPADGTTYTFASYRRCLRCQKNDHCEGATVNCDCPCTGTAWDPRPAGFDGGSDLGVMTISITGTAPPHGYQPAPASYPALPPAAAAPAPAPASVENTEPAVIGDALRLPVIWCDMPRCISWFGDPASAGFADTRDRARAAGWRTDAFGRLACTECQQTRTDYYSPQPVTVQHPGIPRRWHEYGTLPSEDTQDRLTGAADYARYVRRAHPEWAAAMADASDRTVTALCGPT